MEPGEHLVRVSVMLSPLCSRCCCHHPHRAPPSFRHHRYGGVRELVRTGAESCTQLCLLPGVSSFLCRRLQLIVCCASWLPERPPRPPTSALVQWMLFDDHAGKTAPRPPPRVTCAGRENRVPLCASREKHTLQSTVIVRNPGSV